MRSVTLALAMGALVLGEVGCAALRPVPGVEATQSEVELAYDEGPPAERPLMPAGEAEWLIKFEPNLPGYRPLRLRMLLSQPGRLRLRFYAAGGDGRPGTLLHTVEKSYEAAMTSGGRDGKWLSEPLAALPVQGGTLWLGLSVPEPGSEAARLWAARNQSDNAFQRAAESDTALQSSRLPFTPIVRLALLPDAAPVPPPAKNAAPPASGSAAQAPPPAR